MTSALLEEVYQSKFASARERGILQWPSDRYAKDPARFCWDILGFAPTAWQASVLEAIASDDKITVRGARKGGKSKLQATAALWFFCQHPDATSVLVAPTEGQIERIVWHDLLQLHGGSGRCVSCRKRDPGGPRPCPHSACIDGEPSPSCRAGLQVGARRIFGIAPRNSDHMRGISGAHQAYFLDESPGIDEDIEAACEGNVAATGRTVTAFGNPSSRFGWFFDAHKVTSSWRKFSWSAWTSPNVVLGRRVVEGLADSRWCEAMREDLGEDDPRYQVDVLGEFPTRDMMRVLDDVALSRVFSRWETEAPTGKGGLFFGIDAAGGTGGDQSVIASRRGYCFNPLHGFQGGTDRIMVELSGLLSQLRVGNEEVTITYDSAGRYGKDLGIALGMLRRNDEGIRAIGLDGRGRIKETDPLHRSGYSRPRDAYWGNAAQLMKLVVAIPLNEELREDFTFAEWEKDSFGRDRLREKTEQRKATGRSPDFGDAVAYCLWEGRVEPLSEVSTVARAELMQPPKVAPRITYDQAEREAHSGYGDEAFRGHGDEAFGPRRREDS